MPPKERASFILDTREPGGLRTALPLTAEASGFDVVEQALVFCDGVIMYHGIERFIWERKAISDLHNSIADQRVYRELRGMDSVASNPEKLLFLEGDLWAGRAGIYGDSYARSGVHPNSIRGTLLWAQRQNVRIVPTKDIDDTIQALLYLAKSVGVK